MESQYLTPQLAQKFLKAFESHFRRNTSQLRVDVGSWKPQRARHSWQPPDRDHFRCLEQSKRFLEAAKEAEADETAKGAERAFKAVVKPRKPSR